MTDYTQPKYPIYIISKGRADSRFTSKTLDELNVPYRIVIEQSEYKDYNKNIPAEKILVLPEGFVKIQIMLFQMQLVGWVVLFQPETLYGNTPYLKVTSVIGLWMITLGTFIECIKI